MSKETDRQSVLRTTKVRTALKGDNSWIQQRRQAGLNEEEEEEEEKPWVAEVRAGRLNSEFSDPVADNTPEPVPTPNTDSSKPSGYLIRGVFTKTDTKPASSSTNGYNGTSGYTKRASNAYKKIAPHTVRSNVEKTEVSEPSLSAAEQEKRTEAATKMLNSSAAKQRSYVMSAAKKNDSTPENVDSFASPPSAFVAKRVVISDDEDAGPPPTLSVEMSVDEPVSPAKPKAKPESTPKSDTLGALSDTLLSTPQSPSKKPVAQVSSPAPETKKPSRPRVNETITQATSVAPVATLKKTTTETKPEPTPKTSTNPKPVSKTSAMNDNDLLDLSESTPLKVVDPVPTNTDLLTGSSLPKTEKTKGSLDLLAVDIIPIDTTTDKLSFNKTSTKTEIRQTVVQTKTDVKSSLPQTQKAKQSLDLLANDVIPFDTNNDRLSTDKTRNKVETTTTVTQKKTIVKSSADPFDPIPIVGESTKSPVELFDPLLSDSNKGQQQTVSVTFEQKSSKTNSPWDKWAVPTIDTTENSSSTTDTRPEESSSQDPDSEAKKNVVYVKSYVNSPELPRYSSSRYNNDYEYVTSSTSNYAYSSPSSTVGMTTCTYCGGQVGNDSKITIDHLNISSHPECFKCGICSKPMGDFIHSMFLHRGTVHCESCYSNVI